MNYKEDEGQRYRESEELWTCPYDESHLVLPMKFSGHVVRCSKNHPHVSLERCFYNSNHLVKKSKMKQHLRECRDKANYERTYPGGLSSPFNPSNLGVPAVQDDPEDVWEEDWYPGSTRQQDHSRSALLSPPEQRRVRLIGAHKVQSPGVNSPLDWQFRETYDMAGFDAEDWQDEKDPKLTVNDMIEMKGSLTRGNNDSLITHASYDLSPHSSSIGGAHALSPGDFSLYSPRSQPLRSDVPTITMHSETVRSISIEATPTHSRLRDTPVAAATIEQTSGVYRIQGEQAASADEMIYPLKSDKTEVQMDCSILAQDTGENSAGQTIGAYGTLDYTGPATQSTTGEGSGNSYSDKVTRTLNPDEKKAIIKEKRFLEKKISGIEKLEKKRTLGKKLTEEEIAKVGKRFHFERQLETLLAGINLDD